MSEPPTELALQLAWSLLSLCACGHLATRHEGGRCTLCDCPSYRRRPAHEAVVRAVLTGDDIPLAP